MEGHRSDRYLNHIVLELVFSIRETIVGQGMRSAKTSNMCRKSMGGLLSKEDDLSGSQWDSYQARRGVQS